MKRAHQPRSPRWLGVALAALAGCGKAGSGTPSPPVSPPATTPASADATSAGQTPMVPAFVAYALTIAGEYQSWGRVDDELRWAPTVCRLPRPAVARVSESDHAETHGRKLYSVFARNRAAYPSGPHTDQTVVKESWTLEPTDVAYAPEGHRPAGGDNFYPYAQKDGVVYRAKDRAGLYLMWKLAAPTPDSDEGWVYATVTPGGEVTAAGRIAACMSCHRHADHERFFGLPAM